MCARYTLKSSPQVIQRIFNLEQPLPGYRPRYNIAPTQSVAVVKEVEGTPFADAYRWGLVPFWAKDPSIGSRMLNARAETIHEKPAFKNAFAKRRCLIPADGFYEWRALGKKKIPSYFHLDSDEPFAFAGLWEQWDKGEGDPLYTCTLITTAANAVMEPIHDRMPVIFASEEERERWLDPASPPESLLPLLHPYERDDLERYTVSTKVNTPAYDQPDCVDPVEEEPLILLTGEEQNSK